MAPPISDILTARGWSVRHLAQIAGLSYSGVLDHLRGLPQRLSRQRLERLHAVLGLSAEGELQAHRVYAWGVPLDDAALDALQRVLVGQQDDPFADPSPVPLWTVYPLIIGGNPRVPAEFWVFCCEEKALLIRWAPPKNPSLRAVPAFHVPRKDDAGISEAAAKVVEPDIGRLGPVHWAPGMEISQQRISGIPLSPAQYRKLTAQTVESPIGWEELMGWLEAPPQEDRHWAAGTARRTVPASWNDVLARLQRRYATADEAIKALGLD